MKGTWQEFNEVVAKLQLDDDELASHVAWHLSSINNE